MLAANRDGLTDIPIPEEYAYMRPAIVKIGERLYTELPALDELDYIGAFDSED